MPHGPQPQVGFPVSAGKYPIVRSDFLATDLACAALKEACWFRDHARHLEPPVRQLIWVEMRTAARTAVLYARKYRAWRSQS